MVETDGCGGDTDDCGTKFDGAKGDMVYYEWKKKKAVLMGVLENACVPVYK